MESASVLFAGCCFRAMLLCMTIACCAHAEVSDTYAGSAPARTQTSAFVGGHWFDGRAFGQRTVYSVDGRFTSVKPALIDVTIELDGAYVVPPFGEAHNHNIGTGSAERDQQAIARYLNAGVFYVKIQGNLPLSPDDMAQLRLNTTAGLDVVFAQGASFTGTGGHPIALIERVLLPQGYFAGFTKEALRDYRYFTIDSLQELEQKWGPVMRTGPDFIKIVLLYSEEYAKRRDDAAFFGMKGLNPALLPAVVRKAHAHGLSVSAHVATGADFHAAVHAGVDEIAHLPAVSRIAVEDAVLAARHGIVVDTTYAVAVPSLIRAGVIEETAVRRVEAENMRMLRDAGVALAIGSDNPMDTSVKEAEFLTALGVMGAAEVLQIWCGTARTIFPDRLVGSLKDGFEASFLALEGNPLEDFANVSRIRLRVKQGVVLLP